MQEEVRKWSKRFGSIVVVGLAWAAIWAILAVLVGTITGLLSDHSLETHVDPLGAMAIPGFLAGVIFAVVLLFAEGDRRINELPIPVLAAWGAVAGLLLSVLSLLLGTPSDRYPLWLVVFIVVGTATLLSVVSAIGSALLFRLVTRRHASAHAGSEP